MIGRLLCLVGRHDWRLGPHMDLCERPCCRGRDRGIRRHGYVAARGSRFPIGDCRWDWLRRPLCAVFGHRWEKNRRGTQRTCYRCWTAEDLVPADARGTDG